MMRAGARHDLIDRGLKPARRGELLERRLGMGWGFALISKQRLPCASNEALGRLKPAVYELVSRTGAHHAPLFTVKVSIHRLGEASAEGASKQEAETEAATALLNQLQ